MSFDRILEQWKILKLQTLPFVGLLADFPFYLNLPSGKDAYYDQVNSA